MKFSESIVINSPPETIFNAYTEVEQWKTWDVDLQSSSISGAFEQNTAGTLKPVKGPHTAFVLTEVTNNQSFTIESKLPLCTMRFAHDLVTLDDTTTQVTHTLSFTGASSFIFGRLVGRPIAHALPQVLSTLKSSCE